METFKEIDIKYYDNSGNVQVRCTVPVTQDALVHYELMQSHYCKLSFKLSKPIYFLLGDFIDTPYGRFELIDLTKVKDNDTIGYSYEIQFDAYYRKLKNKILKYRPNTGSQEATFSLTSKISTHVEVIMKNLSYYAKLDKSYLYDPKFEGEGTDYTYVIDASVDASASKLITYSNASILDAIANIAQTFNCEWWFEGNILHFGTCENTNAIVDFKLDGNIVSMSSSQNQSTYANRVYAFGAARNLPSGYKNDADADITKDGVVEKRLMLPNSAECSDKNKQLLAENGFELKNGYIQVSGLREDQYVEGVTTNDDIYPRNLIKTSNVASYEKDVEDESTPEEGDLIKRTFYRVGSLTIIGEDGEKTGDMAFRKSYILSGKSLHIVFQSGSLNGMDFECEFNPDGVEEILKDKDGNPILKDGKEQINPKSQVFEIVANEDYGRFLPDITLHPKDGDTFVLYNWDSTKLGDTLVSSASNELLTDAIKNLKKSMIDPTTHTCTAEANYSYNQGRGNLHGVGDRVNLYNKGYGDSYRSSRVIGYEFCLDIPYDGAKYYVGEKPSYSRLNAMESKIEELVYNGQSYLNNGGGSGGSSIYIIKSYDKTSPTEYNVYSARAVYKNFLSKLTDDTAEGLITFAKGLVAKGLADLMMGAKFGYNAKITELGEAFFRAIKSLDYDNAAEQGFSVEKEKNGKYHAFVTNLTIWGKARFHELEVRKLSYSGGNIYLSGAGSKLVRVVPVKKLVSDGVTSWVETAEDDVECVGWKCYLLADNGTTATMNYWQDGDQARCQTMGEIVAGGAYSDVSNKSYWRTIPDGGVSTQNEKIYGTKTETYLDEDGNEQTKEVQVELYDGQAFAWIVIGKHCGDIDGYDDEFSVGYNGSNPAPLETRDIPSAGDTIVLDGNRHRNEQQEYDKTDRQNVIILETTGEYAPRIACYANISEYKHTFLKNVNGEDKEVSLSVFETSPKGGTKINSSRFEWISDDGSTINIINYRGDWVDGNTYHKNDQVNHNNAVWVCVANSGVDVQEEPSDGATYWKKVLSGGKGEKGDDAVSYSVSLMKSLRTIAGHSDQSAVTVSFRKQEGSKSTVSGNITTFGDSASVKCYIDGEYSENMSDWINSGNDYFGYLNYEDAWAGKSVITVAMYIGSNIVASANFSLGQSGEGVVMAYKNATSQPSKPTVEDLSQLSDGWSRTPQEGGSYNKVSNISYGNYSVDNTTSGYSTSEWSEVSDSGETWRKSPAGLSDRFGWAIMKVSFSTNVDNLDVNVIIKAYSEANFDFVQVHELDTEITGSNDLQKKGVAYISGNGIGTSYSYHIATAGQHFFYVSYCKDISGKANGDYGLFRFDLSDNLVTLPSTVWMSQATLKDGKAVLPWSEPVKITGEDAYRVVVSPSVLIFDTDDNGRVTSFSGKTATIRVYQGDKDVSKQFSKYDRLPSNYYNCNGSLKDLNTTSPLEIQVTEIETQVVTDTEGNESTISKTNGFLEFILTNDSATVTAHVDVQVNVAKFTGTVVANNKKFETNFTEISERFKNTPTNDDLTKAESRITQTAREISLSVSEKSIARRNLLVGSAFLREDNNWYLSSDTRIEMNTGYQGTNCIRISDDTTDGKTRYPGVFWDGSQGGKSVKITKGKKYVISCWYFSNDANGHLSLEALYTDKQMNAERKGAPKFLSAGSLVPKPNQWQLFTTVIDTTDAEYDYIAFNFYEYCGINSGLIQAYICRPMVEEGDTYNGWTLSQNDYDVIGANLIDNSRTLDAGGNVLEVKGRKALVGDAYELTYIGSDDYNTLYRIKGSTFKLNTDYTISFEVRGDAKYMGVYAYYPITNTKFTFYAEPQNVAMTEVTDGGKVDNYVTLIQVEELSKQQRVWSHFRFKDRLPEYIYFQFPKNAEQTGVTSWSVTITRPKIEVGAVVTEYTERKSDLIDKASLKAAGIEITSEKVKLYGDQIEVKPKKDGNDVYALFGSDGFINTNILNVQHVYAKNTNGAVYGHFGYLGAEGGTDSAGNQYPLWVGASNCGYAPFSVRSDGYMVTTSGRIGAWSLTERNLTTGAVVDSNYGTYMGTCLSMSEMDTAYNANNCKFLVAMGKGAFYYDPFSPLKSGFYEDAKFRGNASERSDRFHVNSNNEHTYLSNSFYSSMYIKKEIGKDSSSSRVNVSQPALLVDSDGVGITSPGGNFFGGLAIGVLEAKTTTDGQDASSSIREQLDDNRGAFVTINNASGKTTKFYLPKYPQEGQMLIVLQINSGTIQFYASNSKLMAFKNTLYRSGEYWTSTSQGQFSVFVYANDAWRIQLMNGR